MARFDGVNGYVCKHCETFASLTDQGVRAHCKTEHGVKHSVIGKDFFRTPIDECRSMLGKLSLSTLGRGGKKLKGKVKRAYHFKDKRQGKVPVINADTKSILIHCLLEVPITFGQARFIQSGGIQ